MTKIILTRHGHVEGIEPERFRGRMNMPLTEHGETQLKATAARIAGAWKPSMVCTSPLIRCVATGQAIGAACQSPSEIAGGLNDLDYGAWQWLSNDEVRQRWPDFYAAWRATPHLVRFPGGDSLQDLVARTSDVFRFVLSRHASDEVVLVGHDSVNRAFLLQLLDQPLSAYWRIA